ncbi:MAG: lactate dehydrogenase [Anaerovoracaceae bacterium]|jgi:hypothetical protein
MRYISELWEDNRQIVLRDDSFLIPVDRKAKSKYRINILALGDVGSMLLIGLRVMGGDICSAIGIRDISGEVMDRYIHEINQITMPEDYATFPPVGIAKDLFDCDVFLFCASRGVPPLDKVVKDVRMAQLDANRSLVETYAKEAVEKGFTGDFFVVSDPVDQLCKAAVDCGLSPGQVHGFGLGVMNARAAFYDESGLYAKEGRVYGPHGEDLVVANSVLSYDHDISMELTKKTVEANLKVRALGFKPFIAPAFSSGAISVLELLRGHRHYSSLYFGGAFLGVMNRRTQEGDEVENIPLDPALFERIRHAYRRLKEV